MTLMMNAFDVASPAIPSLHRQFLGLVSAMGTRYNRNYFVNVVVTKLKPHSLFSCFIYNCSSGVFRLLRSCTVRQ